MIHIRQVGPIAALLFSVTIQSAVAQNFGEMIRSSDPLTPQEEQATFRVPPGFRVQLFASEPDIQKPMNMAFDARGRLWVSGSNDYPYPETGDQAGDSIRVLEDTDHDGTADRVTVFVDGVTHPIGLYPYRDGVIAFAIPNITFYRDTDGDGKADRRHVLFGPFDYSRDTHGLNNAFRRGLDGWIYACHGFNNHSTVAGSDGHQVSMQSGNTYRFRIDGSRIEQWTHGQVNPFGMTFDHFGDLYSSDCHTKPVTLLMQGGHYPSFGKPHDGLGFVPDVMQHLHGSTAIAGLSQYTGDEFPAEYSGNLFVGNVMTSRVHRDRIEYDGSTANVVELPDFLTSSDPWFRPVDTQCGPDGALYVADFYNRIIGHYEVPLDHPGRDRHRGRIWRVEYVGESAEADATRPFDLTQLPADELVQLLNDPNLPYVYRVVEQLVERVGPPAIAPLQQAIQQPKTATGYAYALWSLFRLESLTDQHLLNAQNHASDIVRIHIQRILAAKQHWSQIDEQLNVAGLKDEAPLVQRAAVMATAQHADRADLKQLLQVYQTSAATDVHLRHAVLLAIRNQLRTPDAYQSEVVSNLSEQDHSLIVRVSLAVQNRESAQFLLHSLDRFELSKEELEQVVTTAARHLDAQSVPQLVALCRERFAESPEAQLRLLQAMETGLRVQGLRPPVELLDWASATVTSIVEHRPVGLEDWTSISRPGQSPIVWDVEPRNTADGRKQVPFLSSLPSGEQGVGTLRSKPFRIPEQLSFHLCGHLGFPNEAPRNVNRVSLHLFPSGQEIRSALAPRHDTARKVVWNFDDHVGQQAYLQITDDLNLRAYAWLAIAEIQPAVVQLPTTNQRSLNVQLQAALQLIAALDLPHDAEEVVRIARSESLPIDVRAVAIDVLTDGDHDEQVHAVKALFLDEGLSDSQRISMIEWLVEGEETTFQNLLKTLTLKHQTTLARGLSQTSGGAELLLAWLTNGSVSLEVLRSQVVVAQLANLEEEPLRREFESLVQSLPKVDQRLQQLMASFRNMKPMTPEQIQNGKAVFAKHCTACHSIGGEGKKIGPQLDGIGNRGLDRLLEDVLTPNRNVDVAFRSRTYLLDNGKIFSGLFRRTEGKLTVIADAKGNEVSFPTAQVSAEKTADVSIMPENWGETIPAQDLRALLAFLMSQRQQPAELKN